MFCLDEKSQTPPFTTPYDVTGTVIGYLHRRHCTEEFKKFSVKLDKKIPAGLRRSFVRAAPRRRTTTSLP
ncbi:hypothetical protein [Streptomyces sp. NPDC004728]|uniref:hypothetical protein n=1 Tax=Streptomyces sp. NPDC004728 TaxID=3154289 RepID=UPI0033A6354B